MFEQKRRDGVGPCDYGYDSYGACHLESTSSFTQSAVLTRALFERERLAAAARAGERERRNAGRGGWKAEAQREVRAEGGSISSLMPRRKDGWGEREGIEVLSGREGL